MKIALAFFGISRSLKYTIGSIQQKILDVLKKNNIEYRIFFHTYKLNEYSNQRTGEYVENMDNEEYKLLNPDYLVIEDQDEVKQQINLPLYRTHKDPWNTNYNSVDNFLLAQYSKSQVVKMIKQTHTRFDYVIFIRPDCLYLQRFNKQYLKGVNNNTISIPNFHLYGKYQFNDRLCISNAKTYGLYGNTFPYMLKMSKKGSLHSETVLGKLMTDVHKLNVKRIPFYFSRVRADGTIPKSDHFNLSPKK